MLSPSISGQLWLKIVVFLLLLSAMELMVVLVVAVRRFQIFFFLHDLNLCGGVLDRVFLLLVMIFICSLEVLVRGYKCKRAIQTATVWLVGVQVP